MNNDFINDVFLNSKSNFDELALRIFNFQKKENEVFAAWQNHIKKPAVSGVDDIPFLPISFFKTHTVVSGKYEPEIIFSSSGTTSSQTSRHYVKHQSVYNRSFQKGFELFYGDIKDYCVLALLPSYLERSGSSLVYMADAMIKMSGHALSGFHLYDYEILHEKLMQLKHSEQKVLLLGVAFALLDFSESFPSTLTDNMVVMETGGMKGRKKEMIKEELYAVLKNNFGLNHVHSEYGMTELLSQAYAQGDGLYFCPPWMRVLIRDEDDPFHVKKSGKGFLNIIDLANIYSCSFIATDDLGIVHEDGSFEVLGRGDNSDIRGCSLLIV